VIVIDKKVLGAYAAVGALSPEAQAEWYRRAAADWQLSCFEIPLFAGAPLAEPLATAFADVSASLVVTLVAQWATKGQVAYGLGSADESARREAVIDAQSVIQQCVSLQRAGVDIEVIEVHVGQRVSGPVAHAVALYRSLLELRGALTTLLPSCRLAVEITDHLAADHPIPFPAAKKAALTTSELLDAVAAANAAGGAAVSVVVNWGRLLINGDAPLEVVSRILGSGVPLAGVILSGAAATPDGFADAHNSHLDPDSGFAEGDFEACATLLAAADQRCFLGMKCSLKNGDAELEVGQVLGAEAELLARA
jgi:hypothetical protein